MDQLKTFLRQCVKYRFWIAVGLSVLLPVLGIFVFSGAIVEATTKRTGEIKAADSDVGKYTAPNPPIPEVTRLVTEKKAALANDVSLTQRKLYNLQEPLLKWPEVVEAKFRTWGRKWPENVDRLQVQKAIYDYTVAYPDFVTRVYQTCNPWNPEDGTGIVYGPSKEVLLRPASFSFETTPELGKVWAEQERLWVMTALLDVVAKVNQDAGAKDWDGAWIKEIVSIIVGSPSAQDQYSLAKGVALEPAPGLYPDGTPPPEAAPDAAAGLAGGMKPGAATSGGEVYYLTAQPSQPYKILPIQMTVRLDQNRLSEFLVGLENSPMAIQVMEPEIAKPTTPIVKPLLDITGFSSNGGGSGGGRASGNIGSRFGPQQGGPGAANSMEGGISSANSRTGSAAGAAGKSGVNKAEERKKAARDAAARAKAGPTKVVDQYFNIVEVTVYGQARFYNTPPPLPPEEVSTASAPAPAPDGTTAPAATDPAATPAPGSEPAKVEPTAPAPTPAPADAPAPGMPAPTQAPAPAPAAPTNPATAGSPPPSR